MKILLVHGVGHCENNPDYYKPWRAAITQGLNAAGFQGVPEFVGFTFDDLFKNHDHAAKVYLEALAELAAAAAWHSIADPLSEFFQPSRDFGDSLQWSAGMVAQLCTDNDLRHELYDQLAQAIDRSEPNLIAAHSLGSLITYDFFRNDRRGKAAAPDATYLTFGSQINNPFARSRLFPGPLKVPNVKFWYHLYNPLDVVLTAPISISDGKFLQITARSSAGHDVTGSVDRPGYLDHPETSAKVWSALATPAGSRSFKDTFSALRVLRAKPPRRALLVGINNYPDPANRLEGCVNDTFLVSSLLQERGFAPENIRLLLDERATAQAIRERLRWLLDGADDGMERVFFYSGHGAQMPGYNPVEVVDHVDECLVPWDFAWTKDTAVTDDDFFSLYSNLPFNARFLAMFDCCHAGGIHRDGGPRVRGIAPPDDIRHRMLAWNSREQMWQQRELTPLTENFGGKSAERAAYMGSNGATYRLGRGMRGRTLTESVYKSLPPDERGPFLPVIVEACQENNLSFEYRDGATSYGAFTYSFVKNLRSRPSATFAEAVQAAADTLKALGYAQEPQILGPEAAMTAPIPGAGRRSKAGAAGPVGNSRSPAKTTGRIKKPVRKPVRKSAKPAVKTRPKKKAARR